MSNDINALRSTLFDTLREVKAGTMDLDRAKTINDTAQVIINTAKAEVDFMKVTGSNTSTDFIPAPRLPGRPQPEALPTPETGKSNTATGTKTVQAVPGGTVTTHRLK